MGRTLNTPFFNFLDVIPLSDNSLVVLRNSQEKPSFVEKVLQDFDLEPASIAASDNDLYECLKWNRWILSNVFSSLKQHRTLPMLANSDTLPLNIMTREQFLSCPNKHYLIQKQTLAVYGLLDQVITASKLLTPFLEHGAKLDVFEPNRIVELFNLGFLPLLRMFGLPLTTFDKPNYSRSSSLLNSQLEYGYVNQKLVLGIALDFFTLCNRITNLKSFDHESFFSKIPRLYSYLGRAILFSSYVDEPTKSCLKTFQNPNYLKLIYKSDESTSLIGNLDYHTFIKDQIHSNCDTKSVLSKFNLSEVLKLLGTAIVCDKPYSSRYLLNQKDTTSKRNYIYSVGYGLLLECAQTEAKRSHIERNILDAYLATDTLISLYCNFGLEPIDSGTNNKKNIVGYGKPTQIKSELIHVFLNQLYIFLPKRLDLQKYDNDERNALLADKNEKSALIHAGFMCHTLKHLIQLLPNMLHLYKGFHPEYFGLPVDLELDDRLIFLSHEDYAVA